MDFNAIQTILGPILVILATQGVKKISSIPISEGQTARIRAMTGVLSFAIALFTAFVDGKLDSFLSPDMIGVAVNAGIVFALSHFGFKKVVQPLGAYLSK